MSKFFYKELVDQEWVPEYFRKATIDNLETLYRIGNSFKDVPPVLCGFLQKANTHLVLDLGSGNGSPVKIILQHLATKDLPLPHFCLTDIFPDTDSLRKLKEMFPENIDYFTEPVDALNVNCKEGLGVRTLFTCFHHFTNEQALKILTDAALKAKGVFIFEPWVRNIKFLPLALGIFFAAMFIPFFLRPLRLKHIFFSALLPVVPSINTHDAVISLLRMRTVNDYKKLIQLLPENNFTWEFKALGTGGLCVMGWKTLDTPR